MIKQKNEDIRALIKEHGLKHFWISNEMGISQYTFCHLLQMEMPEYKREAVLKAIHRVIEKANSEEEE